MRRVMPYVVGSHIAPHMADANQWKVRAACTADAIEAYNIPLLFERINDIRQNKDSVLANKVREACAQADKVRGDLFWFLCSYHSYDMMWACSSIGLPFARP